jgi:glycosyltransferase involved in cell wall biosynthesis
MSDDADERSVLYVLPHPGGGGETYVDLLAAMDGWRSERVYLAAGSKPGGAYASIVRSAVAIQRASRSFDVLHVVGEVAAALCLPALALRCSVLSPQGLHLVRRLDGLPRRAGKTNLSLVVRAATRTICASRDECWEIAGSVGPAAAAKTVLIPNGVKPADRTPTERRAALRSELGVPGDATVGAWVAALDEHKDPLSPIRAANIVRRAGAAVVLLVAGDGPLRAEVERTAREGGDAVRVLGFRRDVDRILAASDFFVLSSRREGLSFALLEAMSQGLAPIVSDAGANVEAVGEAGICVPFGAVARLADAFQRLATEPNALRLLGERARERVARHFSADDMVRRTGELYDEILAQSRPA